MPLAMAQRVQSRATKNSEAQKNKPSSVRKRSPRLRSPERQPSSIGRDLTGSNGIQRAERLASREKTGPGPWLSQAGGWLEVGSEGMVFGTQGSVAVANEGPRFGFPSDWCRWSGGIYRAWGRGYSGSGMVGGGHGDAFWRYVTCFVMSFCAVSMLLRGLGWRFGLAR